MPGKVTDGIIQGGFLFLILATPMLFGSVYPWAYSLIEFVATIMMGAWLVRILVLGKAPAPGVPNGRLFLPAGLFFVLILFQITPLNPRILSVVSPKTAALYTMFLADLGPEQETAGSTASAETGTGEAPGPAEGPASPPSLNAEPGDDPFTTARPISLARDRTQGEGMLFLAYVSLLYLFINFKPDGSVRKFLRRTVVCITVTGILVALIALVQKGLGASRVYGFWQPLQESARLFMGPYINANHFAGYMELVLPVILTLFISWAGGMRKPFSSGPSTLLDEIQSPRNNKLALGILGTCLMVAALFLSLSRAGVTSFIVTLFVLFLVLGRLEAQFRPEHWKKIRKTWKFALFLGSFLLGILALIVFLLKQGGLAGIPRAARFHVWGETLQMVRDFPLFGIGLNCFSVLSPSFKTFPLPVLFTHVENDYLQLLAETGVIGSGMVLLFFALFFQETGKWFRWRAREFLDARNNSSEDDGNSSASGTRLRYSGKSRKRPTYPLPRTNYFLFWGCAASVFSMALHSLADFNLHIPANGLLFFLLLGMMYRLLRLREPVFSFSRGRSRNG